MSEQWEDIPDTDEGTDTTSPSAALEEPGETPLLLYEPPPLDVLPAALNSFVRSVARAMACDAAYALLPSLAACAGAAGIARVARLSPTWVEPPILWLAIVAPSGSRKSPPMEAALAPLRRREDEEWMRYSAQLQDHERALLRFEAVAAAFRKGRGIGEPPDRPPEPQAVRFVVGDVTLEALAGVLAANPRGVLCVRDELAGWFSGFDRYRSGTGGDLPLWLELYRAGRLVIDRKTGQRVVHVARAGVSVCGTVQPGTLRRLASPEYLESGLLARFLFASPPAALAAPPSDLEGHHYERLFEGVIGRLATLALEGEGVPAPRPLALDPEASEAWKGWLTSWASSREDLPEDSALGAVAAKLEAAPARLGLLLHLVEWAEGEEPEPGPISAAAMRAGVALARWFWREARRTYLNVFRGTGSLPGKLLKLVRWVERRGGEVRPHEVAAGLREYRGDTARAEVDLQELVSRGLGRWDLPERSGTGRPPVRVFRLASMPCQVNPTIPAENEGLLDMKREREPKHCRD